MNAYSLVTFRNSQGEKARGTLLKLTRSTVVLEVYNPYSIVQLSEVLHDLTLRQYETVVYRGRAIVSNLVNTGLMLIVSITLIDDWLPLTTDVNNLSPEKPNPYKFLHAWKETNNLQPSYRVAIGRIRCFLADTQRWLEQAQIQICSQDQNTELSVIDDFTQEVVSAIGPEALELLSTFESEANSLHRDQVDAHKFHAQRELHPLIMCAPFVHRAYSKPLGYAGDYEMVNMMLRDPKEGASVFAKTVNAINLKTGPVLAHRNRIDILCSYLSRVTFENAIKHQGSKILNIGCGPAIEIQRFIRDSPLSNECDFTLLDFNEQTIHHTKNHLDKIRTEYNRSTSINFLNLSVNTLAKKTAKNIKELPTSSFDLVYCAGLFDYLSDKLCSRLLTMFHTWVKPGGSVLVTNVHKNNTSLQWMEHILEWYLIYRDSDDMIKISPPETPSRTFNDASNQNIFLEIIKRDE